MSDPKGRAYRKGVLGALMDEFERASEELMRLILRLSDHEFEVARGSDSPDAELRSIRTVIHHVVRAGYGHANHLRLALAAEGSRIEIPLGSRTESVEQLRAMLAYAEATLDGRWPMKDDEISAIQLQSRWGVTYDLEQMLEHMIVHVLRHRRQIERFLTEPQFAPIGNS
jgi:uncharacterized damage-inducible protein DinB